MPKKGETQVSEVSGREAVTEGKARLGGGDDSSRKVSTEGCGCQPSLFGLMKPLGPQRVPSLCGSEAPQPKAPDRVNPGKSCGSQGPESGGKEVPVRNSGPGVLHISGCCPPLPLSRMFRACFNIWTQGQYNALRQTPQQLTAPNQAQGTVGHGR